MSRAERNSQAAVDWAQKKKEQMEKAKRLREERKMKTGSGAGVDTYLKETSNNGYNGANMGGGHAMGSDREDPGLYEMHGMDPPSYAATGFSQKSIQSYGGPPTDSYARKDRGYGSSNYRPSSNQEVVEARQSLMLLKNKMKTKNNMR